ncbi:HAMP domain-containing sensor histidine kinase [Saccharibacillus sp. CPCC 101409]|uniref:sensor histidine kinase n=1 Tax=Saccharibacillus sp. CPCC 101409 TaxID=3058041 RepID=UPI002670DDF0|nr:HAMP domain-containing sensor histidine kinase [Saccharibacillus sp. CPCC 101409]MDO3410295.1 HAMP domain-containing sensor histidine kinase [Saccharibacillus sp. CPCC 101409]
MEARTDDRSKPVPTGGDISWLRLTFPYAVLFAAAAAALLGLVWRQTDTGEVSPAALAAALAALPAVAAAWAVRLRREVSAFMAAAHSVVDGAAAGEPRRTGYAESALSSLEHKLMRFADTVQAHERGAAREKAAIQRLVGDISHQTKTPLSNIVLYTELLEEQTAADEAASRLAREAREQCGKLRFLIGALVEMSRLETGILAMRPERAPVLDVVRAAAAQIRSRAEFAEMELAVDVADEEAVYDAKWTGEALFNVLDNAVKYGRHGGRIRITASRGELFTRIGVWNDGPGISEQERPELFKRFYRGRNAAGADGLGLGLFLAREIAQAQGGRIRISEPPEGGVLFTFFLPAHE